jgi:Cu2+-exporting ATPase
MKTSVIEVHDMLSVFGVDEVEERIGAVPGVESVTVNYAARSATVRYDETRLEVADIKSAVRQRGYESATPATVVAGEGHEDPIAPVAPATAGAASSGTAQPDQALLLPTPPPSPAPLAAASAPTPVNVASTKPQDQAAVDKT